MRRIILAAALSLSLTACAGTVQLNADKAFLTAQAGFHGLQLAAYAGIQSGAITGTTKARVIDLIDQGQVYENEAYAARTNADIVALTGIVSQLVALGVGSK